MGVSWFRMTPGEKQDPISEITRAKQKEREGERTEVRKECNIVTPVTRILWRLRQEDLVFKANPGSYQ
jgi:hypothetical protein